MPNFIQILKKGKRNVNLQSSKDSKKAPPEGEQTAYSSSTLSSIISSYANKIEIYNPDNITLSTYKKIRNDGQINSGLQFTKLPIKSLSFHIECEDEDIRDATQKEAELWFKDLVDKMLRALEFGFSPLEKVWEARNGLWGYKKFKDPDIETIQINIDESGDFNGFTQIVPKNVYVSPEKAFVFTHLMENGNFYGIPRTKPAYPHWHGYEIIRLLSLRYMEKRAIPPVEIRHPPDTDKDNPVNLNRALDLGKELQSNSVVALPNTKSGEGKEDYNWLIKLLEDDKRSDFFLPEKKYHDALKLRSILVPERIYTQDTGAGSYGMADSHFDLFMIAEEGLISDIERAINTYIIPPYIKYNFGENAPVATLHISNISKKNRKVLEDAFAAGMQNGYMPDLDQIAKDLEVPIKNNNNNQVERRCNHGRIHFETDQWRREPTQFEKKVDLKGIEETLDSIENKMRNEFKKIVGWMQESTLRYLQGALEDKNINSINKFNLKYKNDYLAVFKDSLWECFDQGIKSIVKEFKGKITDPSIPQATTQWLNGRASSLTNQYLTALQSKIIMVSLRVNEDTVNNIIYQINETFKQHLNKTLETAIRTETVTCFNLGRQLAVDSMVVK